MNAETEIMTRILRLLEKTIVQLEEITKEIKDEPKTNDAFKITISEKAKKQ